MPDAPDRDFRLDEKGRVARARVGRASLGTAHVRLASGTVGAAVLGIVVSDDGNTWVTHPDAPSVTIGGATRPFRIAGFGWFAVTVTTPNAAEAIAEVYLGSC